MTIINNIMMWGVTYSSNILLLSKGSFWDSALGQILKLLGLLVLFCLILVAAVWTTKLIGDKAIGIRNNNIKVIETYRISNNNAVQIIRVADKYLAIAISKDNVSLLAQLDEDSIIESAPVSEMSSIQFGDILNKAKDKIKSSKKVD